MNENINEFINQSASILVFIVAISLFFVINHNALALTDTVEYAYDGDNVFYEGSQYEKSNKCSGAQLIIYIIQGLEYDIEIDGVFIPKDTDYKVFDFTIIDPSIDYSIKNFIDTSGQISRVLYLRK